MIDARQVEAILQDCLFREAEVPKGAMPEGAVMVEGIVRNFGFHRERLESHRGEVEGMLKQLPPAFRKDGGGGWSFLNMATDAQDQLWGQHRDMEHLLCLAIGLNVGKILLPREMWAMFPGGVPYVSFDV